MKGKWHLVLNLVSIIIFVLCVLDVWLPDQYLNIPLPILAILLVASAAILIYEVKRLKVIRASLSDKDNDHDAQPKI